MGRVDPGKGPPRQACAGPSAPQATIGDPRREAVRTPASAPSHPGRLGGGLSCCRTVGTLRAQDPGARAGLLRNKPPHWDPLMVKDAAGCSLRPLPVWGSRQLRPQGHGNTAPPPARPRLPCTPRTPAPPPQAGPSPAGPQGGAQGASGRGSPTGPLPGVPGPGQRRGQGRGRCEGTPLRKWPVGEDPARGTAAASCTGHEPHPHPLGRTRDCTVAAQEEPPMSCTPLPGEAGASECPGRT